MVIGVIVNVTSRGQGQRGQGQGVSKHAKVEFFFKSHFYFRNCFFFQNFILTFDRSFTEVKGSR